MRTTEMFGKIICQDILPRSPVVPELFLVGSVSHPPISHVCRLGAFGLEVFGDKAERSCVVCHDWGGGLGVSQLFKKCSGWDGLPRVKK